MGSMCTNEIEGNKIIEKEEVTIKPDPNKDLKEKEVGELLKWTGIKNAKEAENLITKTSSPYSPSNSINGKSKEIDNVIDNNAISGENNNEGDEGLQKYLGERGFNSDNDSTTSSTSTSGNS